MHGHDHDPLRTKLGMVAKGSKAEVTVVADQGRTPFEEPTLIAWMLLLPLERHERCITNLVETWANLGRQIQLEASGRDRLRSVD